MAALVPRVVTEDLGKIFEKAICLLYGTAYDGHYRYSLDSATQLQTRLARLPTLCPALTHTAKGGGVYDFTGLHDSTFHLSAKTTKRDGKIAPQLVGQAQPAAFCQRVGIPEMSVPELKCYIQEHITTILPILERNTFSCPTLYYNQASNRCCYIKQKAPIDWASQAFVWTKPHAVWANSSTLKIGSTGILEVQFHSASRSNMAVRWCFEKLLSTFAANFEIVEL
jgi:hypothetical protein